jgi:Ca2+-binding EF-hand superfamily protein
MVAWPLDPPGCKGDVNSDEMVDIDDLFDVLSHWGEGAGPYDVNNDGTVDIDDVFDILYHWGPC